MDGACAAGSDDEQDRDKEPTSRQHPVCAQVAGCAFLQPDRHQQPERHDWLLGWWGKWQLGMSRQRTVWPELVEGRRTYSGAVRPLAGAVSPLRRPVSTLAD